MLKIGQNWGKIANHPPQCSTKICTTGISSSFIEESEEKSSFLWQIISCSLISPLIIAVRIFQKFFDCSFVSTFEPIFILKLD